MDYINSRTVKYTMTQKIKITFPLDLKIISENYISVMRDTGIDLSKAIQEENYTHIQKVAHRIRGCAKCYGLEGLGDICTKIEESIVTKSFSEVSTHIDHFQHYLERIEITYE